MEPLISTATLDTLLGEADVRVVDATLFLPAHGRDARAEYEAAHVPGAVFMDLDEIVDASSGLPHMLPTAEKFASRAQALGLGDGQRIVVYDNSPLRSAARAWWMLRLFGAHDVAVLDGGLEKWRAEGRRLESGRPVVRHRHFTVWADRTGVRDLAAMHDVLKAGSAQVVDARSAARFSGAEPEARAGVRGGHMPGARNLPHSNLFNADGTWKQGDALRAAFADAGVDLNKPIIATCGSGVTAAAIVFGAALLGLPTPALYDGAWAEWGGAADTPVVTGQA